MACRAHNQKSGATEYILGAAGKIQVRKVQTVLGRREVSQVGSQHERVNLRAEQCGASNAWTGQPRMP